MTAVRPPQGRDLVWHEISRGLTLGEQAITQALRKLTELAPEDIEDTATRAAHPTALEDMRAYLASAARDLRAAAALNPRPMRTLDHNQAIRQEWAQLRAALSVGVDVVQYLTLAQRQSGSRKYTEHIVVRDHVRVGRLDRAAGHTLCTIDSYSPGDLSDAADAGEHLYPTCPICVRTAYRVAGRTSSPLLLPNHRR